jgi:hypothetical protein
MAQISQGELVNLNLTLDDRQIGRYCRATIKEPDGSILEVVTLTDLSGGTFAAQSTWLMNTLPFVLVDYDVFLDAGFLNIDENYSFETERIDRAEKINDKLDQIIGITTNITPLASSLTAQIESGDLVGVIESEGAIQETLDDADELEGLLDSGETSGEIDNDDIEQKIDC